MMSHTGSTEYSENVLVHTHTNQRHFDIPSLADPSSGVLMWASQKNLQRF